MNVIGRLVALFFATGMVFLFLAILRGRFDGAGVLAAFLILLALFITVWAAINRKRSNNS